MKVYFYVSFIWQSPEGVTARQSDWVLAVDMTRAYAVVKANYQGARGLRCKGWRPQ